MNLDSTTVAGGPRYAKRVSIGLSPLERLLLFLGIFEIPLGFDAYLAYQEQDAALGAVGGLCISITTISFAALYVLWFADMSLHRRRTLLRPLFGIPMLIYLCVVLFSSLTATKPLLSFFDFALLVQAYLLFFFLANRIQTRGDMVFCVLTLAATIVVQGLLMLAAAATGLNGEAYIGPVMITANEGQRHAGSMHSPNLAGSTLATIWLPVAASLLLIRSKRAWWLLLVATSMGLVGILMTQSRGAILTTFVCSLIILAGLHWRGWLPRWTAIIVVLFCAISFYPLVQFYKNRIQVDDRGSAASRKHLSLIALEAISQRPIVGYGAGNCHLACQRIAEQSKYRAEWFYTVHCKYLLVWVETGVVGLLAFLAILGSGFRQAFSVWRTKDPALSVLGLAFVAALAGQILHMSVDIFNSRTQIQILWSMLGLIAAAYKISHPYEFRGGIPSASRFAAAPLHSVVKQPTPSDPVGAAYIESDPLHPLEPTS